MRKVDVDAFSQDVDEPFSQDRFRVFDSGACTIFTWLLTLHLFCCRFALERAERVDGTRLTRRVWWSVAGVWPADGRATAADSDWPYLGGRYPVGIYPR
jgi:hypothetical protein